MDERSRADKLRDMARLGTEQEAAIAQRMLADMEPEDTMPEYEEFSMQMPDGRTIRWHVRVRINGVLR